MKLLPPILHPWPSPIPRRHTPPAAQGRFGYRSYRQCLRWEFGFTCAFCLCHESDLALYGVEGTGLTHVEHFVPVSRAKAGTNDYANCFYICRFCNGSRSAKPTRADQIGARLLNPCLDAWADAFVLVNDEFKLSEVAGKDAAYTLDAYALNDPRKIRMRRRRRREIRERLAFISRSQAMAVLLLEKASRAADPELVDGAKLLKESIRRAWQDLERFAAIPRDARTCACGEEAFCILPQVLELQTHEVSQHAA